MANQPGTDTAGTIIGQSGGSTTVSTVAAAGATQTVPPGASVGILELTLTANLTLTFPAPVAGAKGRIVLTQDGTGSRTLTLGTAPSGAVKFVGGTHTLSTAAASVDVIDWWSDGVNVYCNLTKAYA